MSASDQLVIRPGTPADLVAVEQIEIDCFGDPWPRGALCAELAADRLRYPVVAEQYGQVVGYLMAWRVVDQLHILNLAVASPWRRQGVATCLLADALQEAVRRHRLQPRPPRL